MFKYNNMDHSILTGLYAAQNILAEELLHSIWEVNTDEEYHEKKPDVVKMPKTTEVPKRKAA